MFRCFHRCAFILAFAAPSSLLMAEQDTGWRISPENINIQVGYDRPLQLLDDDAQELHGAEWSIDHPELADLTEVDGRAVILAKAAGLVKISAVLNLEKRSREIKIWPATQPLPQGTSTWGTHSIGRDLGDLAAVPVEDGVNMFSLEQNGTGRTYLRALTDDGIQVWSWLMPEPNQQAELVCGDWLGGALISSNHSGSFTLYTVGKDGKLRWQRTLPGIRKAHAYNTEHLVHILSQSPDRTITKITGLDEETGAQKFELTVPASHERRTNVMKAGSQLVCASNPGSSAVPTGTSRLFVNIDGFAYFAFTRQEWELSGAPCAPGSVVQPADLQQVREQSLVLWQIHPDGTVRNTVVEASASKRPFLDPVAVASPTGSIIPDGLGGVLFSAGSTDVSGSQHHTQPDEFVYRVDQEGKLVYKLLLPLYEGNLHDEMVLGDDDRGFATRGGILVAFSVSDGRETWRWDSQTSEIKVFAALANGGCLVQTPTALVEVDNSSQAKEMLKGQAALDWRGQLYHKTN